MLHVLEIALHGVLVAIAIARFLDPRAVQFCRGGRRFRAERVLARMRLRPALG